MLKHDILWPFIIFRVLLVSLLLSPIVLFLYITTQIPNPFWGVVLNIWFVSLLLGLFIWFYIGIGLVDRVVTKADLNEIADELAELKAGINEIKQGIKRV